MNTDREQFSDAGHSDPAVAGEESSLMSVGNSAARSFSRWRGIGMTDRVIRADP
jgi:hypothetical protein